MRGWLRRVLGPAMTLALVTALVACGSAPPTGARTPAATPTSPPTPPPPVITAPATPAPCASPAPCGSPEPGAPPAPPHMPTPPFPWPSGIPTVGPGQVEFALLVAGTPAPGEELDLSFQAPGVGQNEFQLCGGPNNACRPQPGQVYTWGARNVSGGSAPWAFQKRLNGTTTTIQSGTVDASQGALVTAITAS